ncbi:hypothetical protein PBRA_001924 [Plasmodiophora brassicae]|nr:hypothetical protein PBRA_001924 [Plasmodiophora brassicae]
MLWGFYIDASWSTQIDFDKFNLIVVLSIVLAEVTPVLAAVDWRVFALFVIEDIPSIHRVTSPTRWCIPFEELSAVGSVIAPGGRARRGKWLHHDVAIRISHLHRIPTALVSEIALQASRACDVRHENLVAALGVSVFDHGLAIVSEWMPMGNVYDFVQRSAWRAESGTSHNGGLRRSSICRIMRHVAAAMAHLGANGMFHGHLTTASVLFDGTMTARVDGFGQYSIRQLVELCGAQREHDERNYSGYSAPEVLNGSGATIQSDVYSAGCILNFLCTLQVPFVQLRTRKQLRRTVVRQKGRPALPSYQTPFSKIIQECWMENPDDRPTFPELLRMFSSLDQ